MHTHTYTHNTHRQTHTNARTHTHTTCAQVDVVHGQKTGFFLDQRDNRACIGRLSAVYEGQGSAHNIGSSNSNGSSSMGTGLRCLNVFAYTGGFSVYAGRCVSVGDEPWGWVLDCGSGCGRGCGCGTPAWLDLSCIAGFYQQEGRCGQLLLDCALVPLFPSFTLQPS